MTADLVPTCVQRGLSTLTCPDGSWTVYHANEADLRDALSALWWLHGADVQTEVPIPNCGRVDLLVRLPNERSPWLWEIKRRVETVSAARKAFQQADTYSRYLAAHGTDVVAFVTAAVWNETAVASASSTFYSVRGMSFGEALAYPEIFGTLAVVRQRMAALEQLLHHLRSAAIDIATRVETTALRLGDVA